MKKWHWVIIVLFIFIFCAFLYYTGLVGSLRSTLPPAPPMNQAENNAAWLQQAAFWVQVALALGTFGAVICSLFAIQHSRETAKRQLYPRLRVDIDIFYSFSTEGYFSKKTAAPIRALFRLSIINTGLVPCSISKMKVFLENDNSEAANIIQDSLASSLHGSLFTPGEKDLVSLEQLKRIVSEVRVPIFYEKENSYKTHLDTPVEELFFQNASLKVEIYDHENNCYTSNTLKADQIKIGLQTLTNIEVTPKKQAIFNNIVEEK